MLQCLTMETRSLRAKNASAKTGPKDFVKRHLVGIKRVQYTVIIVLCSGFLTVQCVECINKFLAKRTATGDYYVHTSRTSFPVLTICPTHPYRLDVLQVCMTK